jgi:hypothetical protein
MKIEDASIIVLGREIPLSSINIPPHVQTEIENFTLKLGNLLEREAIPNFLKGKTVELRMKVKLD